MKDLEKKLKELRIDNDVEIRATVALGRKELETAIANLEDTIRYLKRRLRDYDDVESIYDRSSYLDFAANDLLNCAKNDRREWLNNISGQLRILALMRQRFNKFC